MSGSETVLPHVGQWAQAVGGAEFELEGWERKEAAFMEPYALEKAFEGSMEEGMPSSEMVIPFALAAVDKFCDSAGGVRSAE